MLCSFHNFPGKGASPLNESISPHQLSIYQKILRSVASDSAGRGAPRLASPQLLHSAVELLRASHRPAIITGFVVPPLGVAETDGPPGAAVLARALRQQGKDVLLVTDTACFPVVSGAARSIGYEGPFLKTDIPEELFSGDAPPDLLVFVERLGRGEDGKYYNMRCEEIGAYTAPLDGGALLAEKRGIPCLAVGDGGNEAGMGFFYRELREMLPGFASCISAIGATVTLPVDVSNWGCYALAGLLGDSPASWLGIREGEELAMLQAMEAEGAVDGATKKQGHTVDGMSLERQIEVAREIREILAER